MMTDDFARLSKAHAHFVETVCHHNTDAREHAWWCEAPHGFRAHLPKRVSVFWDGSNNETSWLVYGDTRTVDFPTGCGETLRTAIKRFRSPPDVPHVEPKPAVAAPVIPAPARGPRVRPKPRPRPV